jgi:hypothetical protein
MSHTTHIKSVPIINVAALQACIAELAAAGVNISLEANAQPRMYYADQLQRHLKQKSEVADFVVKLPDAFYDIALLKQEDGSYSIAFDDYGYAGHHRTGTVPIKKLLGIPHKGQTEHWAGERVDPLSPTHSVAKLLQGYTKHAIMQEAAMQGHFVQSCYFDNDGALQLEVGVPG